LFLKILGKTNFDLFNFVKKNIILTVQYFLRLDIQ